MNQAYINNKKYDVPGTWNELDKWQLRQIAKIVHSNKPRPMARILILLILMRTKVRPWLAFMFLFRMGAMAKYDLLPAGDWVFDECTLTKAILPKVRSRWRWLYAPKDGIIKDITFIEFIKCETAYLNYRKHFADMQKRTAHLQTLCAILYRRKEDGKRIKYDDDNLHLYRKDAKGVGNHDMLCTLLWYDGCRNDWKQYFTEIYREATTEEMTPDDDPTADVSANGWISSLHMMAGGALYMEQLSYTRAFTALYSLNQKLKENREMAERLEASKNQ